MPLLRVTRHLLNAPHFAHGLHIGSRLIHVAFPKRGSRLPRNHKTISSRALSYYCVRPEHECQSLSQLRTSFLFYGDHLKLLQELFPLVQVPSTEQRLHQRHLLLAPIPHGILDVLRLLAVEGCAAIQRLFEEEERAQDGLLYIPLKEMLCS